MSLRSGKTLTKRAEEEVIDTSEEERANTSRNKVEEYLKMAGSHQSILDDNVESEQLVIEPGIREEIHRRIETMIVVK